MYFIFFANCSPRLSIINHEQRVGFVTTIPVDLSTPTFLVNRVPPHDQAGFKDSIRLRTSKPEGSKNGEQILCLPATKEDGVLVDPAWLAEVLAGKLSKKYKKEKAENQENTEPELEVRTCYMGLLGLIM